MRMMTKVAMLIRKITTRPCSKRTVIYLSIRFQSVRNLIRGNT
jgi:hypothetical protein